MKEKFINLDLIIPWIKKKRDIIKETEKGKDSF